MEYISSFTYCDTIQTEMTPQGPQQQIVKPLQALTPIAIPGNFSFAIACSIAGFDTSKENSVKIMFLDPSNNVLYDTGDVNFQLPTEQIKPSGIASISAKKPNNIFSMTSRRATSFFFIPRSIYVPNSLLRFSNMNLVV